MKREPDGVARFLKAAERGMAADVPLARTLQVARFLGEVLWKNATGVYQLAAIERALLDRVDTLIPAVPVRRDCRFGHVLTKAYDTGGHTRLVERLVVSEALADSMVLVTESAPPVSRERLGRARHGCTVLPRMARGEGRIAALVKAFSQCEVLILYVHPHDIESVLAAGIAQRRSGVRVLLFNHADHVFSWGYGIAERVLEISHFGWALRGERQCEDKSVFVGIPLGLPETPVERLVRAGPPAGPVVAAGTAYKFRPAQDWSFPGFVDALCQRSDCNVAVIGPNRRRDWWWWPVLRERKGRVTLHARLEYEQYLSLMSTAAACVDSFPLVGGTAFAEVIARGIPGFGVLTGSHGYSPADLVKSPTLGALLDEVANFMATGQRDGDEQALLARLHAVHDVEAVAMRVRDAVEGDGAGNGAGYGVGVPPPWPCPVPVDAGFYGRMWQAQRWPTIPVHVVPPLPLVWPFLMMKA